MRKDVTILVFLSALLLTALLVVCTNPEISPILTGYYALGVTIGWTVGATG